MLILIVYLIGVLIAWLFCAYAIWEEGAFGGVIEPGNLRAAIVVGLFPFAAFWPSTAIIILTVTGCIVISDWLKAGNRTERKP